MQPGIYAGAAHRPRSPQPFQSWRPVVGMCKGGHTTIVAAPVHVAMVQSIGNYSAHLRLSICALLLFICNVLDQTATKAKQHPGALVSVISVYLTTILMIVYLYTHAHLQMRMRIYKCASATVRIVGNLAMQANGSRKLRLINNQSINQSLVSYSDSEVAHSRRHVKTC